MAWAQKRYSNHVSDLIDRHRVQNARLAWSKMQEHKGYLADGGIIRGDKYMVRDAERQGPARAEQPPKERTRGGDGRFVSKQQMEESKRQHEQRHRERLSKEGPPREEARGDAHMASGAENAQASST